VRNPIFLSACFLTAIAAGLLIAESNSHADDVAQERENNWPEFRGPLGDGNASAAKPPIKWNEDEGIRWKIDVPGVGSSTPIVWNGRIYLTSSLKTDKVDAALPKAADQPERKFGITYPNQFYQLLLLCYDATNGKEIWRQTVTEAVPHQGHHPDNNFASATLTTDGKRLYVPFASLGFYCYSLTGEFIWKRELGQVDTRLSFGEASSLVVHDGKVLICRDNEGQSYMVALNSESGETMWRVDRDEPSAWATPLIVKRKDRTHVVTNGKTRIRSYDLGDGALLWECGGQVSNVTPCPVADGDLVFCMSGYRGNSAQAIKIDSNGDITGGEQVAWSLNRSTPYVPSPILHRGLLYFTQTNSGILNCVDAESGESVIERTRMEGISNLYASPVAADGRIYFVGRSGATLVLQHGREFKVLALNQLDDFFDASPALAGDTIYLRGRSHLYAIGKEIPSVIE
jgi:outer membrane protein assembly factor BamB